MTPVGPTHRPTEAVGGGALAAVAAPAAVAPPAINIPPNFRRRTYGKIYNARQREKEGGRLTKSHCQKEVPSTVGIQYCHTQEQPQQQQQQQQQAGTFKEA